MEMELLGSKSDEDLATRVRDGDEPAFQELMRRYGRQIFNFARQYTRGDDDVEDITQDTFFKLWKYIKKFDPRKRFRPWLFTIARNTALDLIKKKRSSSFSEIDSFTEDSSFADTIEDTEPLPDDIFEHAELAKELTEAMEILHPDHRAVLIMHYRDAMTFDEIAEVVGSPMNTVKSWHRRALIKIRGELLKRNSARNPRLHRQT